MSILLFVNLKGGVAKTTNAVAVAECLAESGYRTLLIDADHQCMASELLIGEDRLYKCDHRNMTLHDLLAAMLDDDFEPGQFPYYVVDKVSEIAGGLPNLSLLPCSIRIDDFVTNMAKARRGFPSAADFQSRWDRRRSAMRKWLKGQYDFTIVDCPPSIAIQVTFFLRFADFLVIPSIPDRLSVRGSRYLLDRIRRGNYRIQGLGTLWSLYREQNKMHRKIVELALAGAEPLASLPRPFEAIIPNAAAIAEATEPGRNPKSFSAKYTPPFAKLYKSLCEEIVQRSQWHTAQASRAGAAVVVGSV
jgi:chromosome partitioning protein